MIVSKALNMNFTVADFALVAETLAQTEASLSSTQTELTTTQATLASAINRMAEMDSRLISAEGLFSFGSLALTPPQASF